MFGQAYRKCLLLLGVVVYHCVYNHLQLYCHIENCDVIAYVDDSDLLVYDTD